jgi:hypothetical protein
MDFYWNVAPMYLGYGSSYSSFQYRMEGGRPTASSEMSLDSIQKNRKHIARYNRIQKLYSLYSSDDRAKLNAIFNQENNIPHIIKTAFGELAGLSLFHPTLSDILYTHTWKSGLELRLKNDKKVATQIKLDIKKDYQRLQDLYYQYKQELDYHHDKK